MLISHLITLIRLDVIHVYFQEGGKQYVKVGQEATSLLDNCAIHLRTLANQAIFPSSNAKLQPS